MRWLAFLMLGFLGCGVFAQPGRACRKQEECDGLERGYCAKVEICTRACSPTDTCPDNSTCTLVGKRSICLPTCEADTDCLSGFVCYQNTCQYAAPLEPPARQ